MPARDDYDEAFNRAERRLRDHMWRHYYQRAEESFAHSALYTHIHPVDLMHLIDVWNHCQCGAHNDVGDF